MIQFEIAIGWIKELNFFVKNKNHEFDNISNYLGCGKCYFSRNEVNLIVSTFSDINHKIISLFNKYPLLGTKKEDYLDFCKVAELIKSKDHLTKQGIENIKRIKSNMNSKRIHS